MTFTAIVVTWNSAGEVGGLIESVERHLPGRCELLFVDNASTDGTAALIRERSPASRLIELERNIGFGPANNLGVGSATSDVVVLLNPDTLLVDDSLARLAELASRERALFGPRLLNDDGSPQISAWPPVAGWASGLVSVWPGALMPKRLRIRCEPWRYDERSQVGWISGACIAARRELLAELGPFDEQLPLYGEDTDTCLRAWQLGVPSVFAPDVARIVHLGGRSGSQAFADVGTRRKIDARRWIVRTRLGRWRAAYDFAAEVALHALRWAAKSLTRRDASFDSRWLRSALGRRGSPERAKLEEGPPSPS
jgi:GT2 family glycosyltransferase